MSTKSFPFNSEPLGQNEFGFYIGDRDMDSSDWAEYFGALVGNGIFAYPKPGLTVSAAGGMTVSVSEGRAWINGYYFRNLEPKMLQLAPANGLPRVDRIVVRWDLIERQITLAVKEGEPSEKPAPPELERSGEIYELGVAEAVVTAGAEMVGSSEIKDTRLDGAVCGLVAAFMDRVDFTSLFRQYSSQFNEWFEYIRGLTTENITSSIIDELARLNGATEKLSADFAMWITSGISENADVVTRSKPVTAASGTVVFSTPFDVVPLVYFPQGGTVSNVTKTGFTFSGAAAGRHWVAIADDSD